ncbi:mRNA endoribonuclease LsoA [Brevibacillus reuszeri]|uniref:type II toxin-antitoxin system RnlA family toxin n=1 Tax=Brevibacillus reuszeri TaxID=54915 RepID=UPI001B06A8DF|nr:type II toxin-antitoxin system RnlA family toxin [Brevibacillus reuszeri]GIO06268.1 mRNA endoribonuclease LsoA [Brevibacillus reuszeri]
MAKKKNPFKGLHLDRTKLPMWISESCDKLFKESRTSDISLINNVNQYRCLIYGDNKEITLDFYYNGDGTTTIYPGAGKHTDLSLKIATEILSKLEFKEKDAIGKSYSITSLESEEFELIKEYLESLEGVELINFNSNNNYFLYQYQSKIGDKITLKYYGNQTLQVQGKPLYLYQEVTCLLSQYFPFDEMIRKQAEFFNVSINPVEIRNEMQELLPTAYNILDEQLRKIMSASLAYQKIDMELEDYSSFVFPVLRTLEGYIKFLFSTKNITVDDKDGFNYFKKVSGIYVLTFDTKQTLNCSKTESAIEKCYNYFKKHRHGLFHTSSIAVATRTLDTKQSADKIINEVFALIEDTYCSIIN